MNPKVFIQKVRNFISENPKRAKFIALIAIAACSPLIVLAALTVQNLQQKASADILTIVDENGSKLETTFTPQVALLINLPSGWTTNSSPTGLIPKVYAISGQTCDNLGGNDCSGDEQCIFNDPACVSGCEGVCQPKTSPTPIVSEKQELILTPTPTVTATPTVNQADHVVQRVVIANIDSGQGGDEKRDVQVKTFPSNIVWKLNPLNPGETKAQRIVQATFYSTTGFSQTYISTIELQAKLTDACTLEFDWSNLLKTDRGGLGTGPYTLNLYLADQNGTLFDLGIPAVRVEGPKTSYTYTGVPASSNHFFFLKVTDSKGKSNQYPNKADLLRSSCGTPQNSIMSIPSVSPIVSPAVQEKISSDSAKFDFNRDNKIDYDDIKAVINVWNKSQKGQGLMPSDLKADLNGDGKVNQIDYNEILRYVNSVL